MSEAKLYRKTGLIGAVPWSDGTDMDRVSLSPADRDAGHPMFGGMIAWSPANPDDRWYIAPEYFAKNYEAA